MSTNARFHYFNNLGSVTSCYNGSVKITSQNIQFAKSNYDGSCVVLGLKKITCPKGTYGCSIVSSRPSKALAVGDVVTFGCEPQQTCDETPGINCCIENNCNCDNGPVSSEDAKYLAELFRKRI
jgi:hypothetical protein